MIVFIIAFLHILAILFNLIGLTGLRFNVPADLNQRLSVMSLITGISLVFLDLNSGIGVYQGYLTLALLYFLSALFNILSANQSRITITFIGTLPQKLADLANQWKDARTKGNYHAFLAGMDYSDFINLVADGLRVVYSIAILAPEKHGFIMTDSGFVVIGYEMDRKRTVEIFVCLPGKEDGVLQGKKPAGTGDMKECLLVSEKNGIILPELLDRLAESVLYRQSDNQ
ncbi:hypothetical protein [Parabacteroides merdae]|uniref:hypothetical protein n=1 Tax=Parabacteroides merdae TaxID=46503 RepID=UPI0034A1AD0B